MTRKITATVLALSIAMTSLTATPVRAGNNDDLGRFVAGAITLFIIGKAIEQGTRSNRNVSRSTQNPSHYPGKSYNRANKRLPQECYFRMRTDNGTRGVYGKICLNEIMRRANRLPEVCERRVRVKYGRRADVYGAHCLKKHGYKTASRR